MKDVMLSLFVDDETWFVGMPVGPGNAKNETGRKASGVGPALEIVFLVSNLEAMSYCCDDAALSWYWSPVPAPSGASTERSLDHTVPHVSTTAGTARRYDAILAWFD